MNLSYKISNYIIPKPLNYTESEDVFDFGNNPLPTFISEEANSIIYKSFFDTISDFLPIKKGNETDSILYLHANSGLDPDSEEYELKIEPKKIILKAKSHSGFLYGMVTLSQLYLQQKYLQKKVHCCTISDKPEFKWRGIMLDVVRHMLPIDYIKQFIDLMSYYKLNSLHLHLTDDQGWRIEIKQYPNLTKVGSWRKETLVGWQLDYKSEEDFLFDNKPYGGYYTQEQLKDLVEYAKARNINVVPEIEMPGHATALLAAYPELACNKKQNIETATYWGIFDDIICPTDEAIAFMKNVLDEVCDIFPSKYIHIGGDEVPKTNWKNCDFVEQLMKKHNIANVEKVQGWFNRQIEEHLNKKNRLLIGWDEILDGGISNKACVMSWQGEKGGIRAANSGNYVVMSPGNHSLYWDYKYDNDYCPKNIGRNDNSAPTNKLYEYYPIPDEIDDDKKHFILGVQANIWSEYILNPKQHQYLAFPRIFALAEIAWSEKESKNWTDFVVRNTLHYRIIDKLNFNYHIFEPILIKTNEKFYLYSCVPNSTIYYTTDGSIPSDKSLKYNNFPIDKNTLKLITARTFVGDKSSKPVGF